MNLRAGLALCALVVALTFPCAAAQPRIVSLDGTTTEILAALGVGNELVGRDDSSYYPASVRALPSIGYQFAISAEGILSLRPSLVIGRAGVRPQSALEQIRQTGVSVTLIPDAPTLENAQRKIRLVAAAVHREQRGAQLIAAMQRDERTVRAQIAARGNRPKARVLVLLEISPQMVLACGPDSGPGAMIGFVDARNALPGMHSCKTATTEAILAAAPNAIVLLNRGGDRASGMAALAQIPGIAQTPAAHAHREFVFDSLYIAGFGPRTGRALRDLFGVLYGRH